MDRESHISPIPVFKEESCIPAICGGLSFESLNIYEQPELGVSFRYGTLLLIHADAYLYDLGLPSITSDLKSPEVMVWFQQACENIFRMAAVGDYTDLEVKNSQFLHLPSDAPEPFCLWSEYTYGTTSGPGFPTKKMTSHIALRTDRGFINKVRYTYPCREDTAEAGFYGYCTFLVDWTIAIQKFGCSE